MSTTFKQLGLSPALVSALMRRGITSPFPVQEFTIPDALEGRDVCGKAPTGSGKTLAFGLPLLDRVEVPDQYKPTSLILAPTRELVEQIKDELQPLARADGKKVMAVYGGVGYGPQKKGLRDGVDVLVAAPGRLEDLIQQGVLSLERAGIVVIDEADRMADMGFLPAVKRILDQTPKNRQTLLFSATLDGDVGILVDKYQNNPARHEAPSVETDAIDAQHHFWLVEQPDRTEHTAEVVQAVKRTIIFTRTRHGADRLGKRLNKMDVSAAVLHGGMGQSARQRNLKAFESGKARALIATDVAARGIHIDNVSCVLHYDPPADHKDYVHRSGRTARAGATGNVVSLVSNEQVRAVKRLQKSANVSGHMVAPDVSILSEDVAEFEKQPKPERQVWDEPEFESSASGKAEPKTQKRDSRDKKYDRRGSDRSRSYDRNRNDRRDDRQGGGRSYDRDSRKSYDRDSKPRSYDRDARKSYDRDSKPRSYDRDARKSYDRDSKPRSYDRDARKSYDRDSKPRSYHRDARKSYDRDSKPRSYDRDSRSRSYDRNQKPERRFDRPQTYKKHESHHADSAGRSNSYEDNKPGWVDGKKDRHRNRPGWVDQARNTKPKRTKPTWEEEAPRERFAEQRPFNSGKPETDGDRLPRKKGSAAKMRNGGKRPAVQRRKQQRKK